MKKILTFLSTLIATTSLINQSTFAYSIVEEEKTLNTIISDDFNENKIEKLITSYFNSFEGIKHVKELDINRLKEKTLLVLGWLSIAHLIDEKEKIKTILETSLENIDPFALKVNNEKTLKALTFMFFFFVVNEESERIFEVTVIKPENDENNKLNLKIEKIFFNNFKSSYNMYFNEEDVTITMHENNILNSNDENIFRQKFINIAYIFGSNNFNFEYIKTLYDEVQFEEKTFTIDFTNLVG